MRCERTEAACDRRVPAAASWKRRGWSHSLPGIYRTATLFSADKPNPTLARRPTLARHAAYLAFLFAVAACGNGDPTAPRIDVTGIWVGADELYDSLHIDLTQAADGAVTGTAVRWSFGLFSRESTVIGSLQEATLSLALMDVNPSPILPNPAITLQGRVSGGEFVGTRSTGPFHSPIRLRRR